MSMIFAVDLGKKQDYTAFAVLQSIGRHYHVRHLERLPLQTLYPRQQERIAELYDDLKRQHDVSLVVDSTGAGTPPVDALRVAGLPVIGVYVHGGSKTTREGDDYNVPKQTLVSLVHLLLETERLAISSSLPDAAVLKKELHGFKYEIGKSGHVRFGNDVGNPAWREAEHDDLVFAVALACWYGENAPVKTTATDSMRTMEVMLRMKPRRRL